jgi:hypothetical protein
VSAVAFYNQSFGPFRPGFWPVSAGPSGEDMWFIGGTLGANSSDIYKATTQTITRGPGRKLADNKPFISLICSYLSYKNNSDGKMRSAVT